MTGFLVYAEFVLVGNLDDVIFIRYVNISDLNHQTVVC